MIEVERKFVCDPRHPAVLAILERSAPCVIEQGYLIVAGASGEVRIRRSNGAARLTIKRGAPPAREEVEVSLDTAQYDRLWPLTAAARLEKGRYRVPFGKEVIELDVYRGVLSGLVVAEVEFESIEAARAFEAPEWFDREVTEDRRYANQTLAGADAVPL
ncbi:MAG: CYTH domain-containing protein [Spirochaetales bacterium]|nr:CYTH domain-containing protein [Spirochaetales bacterium]